MKFIKLLIFLFPVTLLFGCNKNDPSPSGDNLSDNFINVNGVKLTLEKAFIERRKIYGSSDRLFIWLTDNKAVYDERRNRVVDATYTLIIDLNIPDSDFIRTSQYPFVLDWPASQSLPKHYALNAHFYNDGSISELETVLGDSGDLFLELENNILSIRWDVIDLSEDDEYLIGSFSKEYFYFES